MGVDVSAPPRGDSLAAVRAEYLDALLASDVPGAHRAIGDAITGGVDVRGLYLDVLQPAMYEIGRLWSHAEISVAQEHLATAATQSAMARLSAALGQEPRRGRRGTAICACVTDELHAVGGRVVADFLEADGWDVVFLGALTPSADLAALAAEREAIVVALSAALPERIPRVREVIAALRALDPAPFVLGGGQAF